jgi:hypothetical protein
VSGWRKRVALALLAPLAFVALVELGLRWFVLSNEKVVWRPLPPFGRCDSPADRAWLARQKLELAREGGNGGAELDGGASGSAAPLHARAGESFGMFDPLLGWTNRPGGSSPDGRVRLDELGLRGTDALERAGRAELRIVACGDSFTFGEEVADGETWAALLEESWPTSAVLNLGVGGYGTDQALLRLRALAPSLGRIDAVLVGLLLENIGRNVNRYRPLWYPSALPGAKPRFVLEGGGTLELVPQPFATRADFVAAVESGDVLARLAEHEHWGKRYVPDWLAWSAAVRLVAGKRAYAERDLRELWSEEDGEPYRTTLALLEAFREEARSLGSGQFFVLVFPTRQDLQLHVRRGRRYWNGLLVDLEERGIPALDLAEPLAEAERARGPTDPPLYRVSHFSPEGNAIVARVVREWLAPRLRR